MRCPLAKLGGGLRRRRAPDQGMRERVGRIVVGRRHEEEKIMRKWLAISVSTIALAGVIATGAAVADKTYNIPTIV